MLWVESRGSTIYFLPDKGNRMSASACIAFFGLRYETGPDEIELLEARSDPRQIAARRAGLNSYWANFGGDVDRYRLLVGTRIASLGPEDSAAASLPFEQLSGLMSDTMDKLRAAGLEGDAGLHLEWLADS